MLSCIRILAFIGIQALCYGDYRVLSSPDEGKKSLHPPVKFIAQSTTQIPIDEKEMHCLSYMYLHLLYTRPYIQIHVHTFIQIHTTCKPTKSNNTRPYVYVLDRLHVLARILVFRFYARPMLQTIKRNFSMNFQ